MGGGVELVPKRKNILLYLDDGANTTIEQISNTTINIIKSTSPVNLDDIADGITYERTLGTQLSGGIYLDATSSVKGIATFPTTDFSVSSGSVTILEATNTVKGKATFPSTDFSVSSGSVTVVAASPTVAGKIEIATAAETTTGTDNARAISPDGLAGSSIFGVKVIGIIAVDATTDLSVADGKAYVPVPAALNGMNLIRAQAIVITAGTTNPTTIDIYNVTDSQDMLSTAISIASGATVGTVGTVNASYDDVATNDVLRVDVTTMSTTAPKGLLVVLEFQLP